VQDRPLVGKTQQLSLGIADGLGAGLGSGEDLVLTHLRQRRPGHETTQALATDSQTLQNPFLHKGFRGFSW
jgi:hypothetical protein